MPIHVSDAGAARYLTCPLYTATGLSANLRQAANSSNALPVQDAAAAGSSIITTFDQHATQAGAELGLKLPSASDTSADAKYLRRAAVALHVLKEHSDPSEFKKAIGKLERRCAIHAENSRTGRGNSISVYDLNKPEHYSGTLTRIIDGLVETAGGAKFVRGVCDTIEDGLKQAGAYGDALQGSLPYEHLATPETLARANAVTCMSPEAATKSEELIRAAAVRGKMAGLMDAVEQQYVRPKLVQQYVASQTNRPSAAGPKRNDDRNSRLGGVSIGDIVVKGGKTKGAKAFAMPPSGNGGPADAALMAKMIEELVSSQKAHVQDLREMCGIRDKLVGVRNPSEGFSTPGTPPASGTPGPHADESARGADPIYDDVFTPTGEAASPPTNRFDFPSPPGTVADEPVDSSRNADVDSRIDSDELDAPGTTFIPTASRKLPPMETVEFSESALVPMQSTAAKPVSRQKLIQDIASLRVNVAKFGTMLDATTSFIPEDESIPDKLAGRIFETRGSLAEIAAGLDALSKGLNDADVDGAVFKLKDLSSRFNTVVGEAKKHDDSQPKGSPRLVREQTEYVSGADREFDSADAAPEVTPDHAPATPEGGRPHDDKVPTRRAGFLERLQQIREESAPRPEGGGPLGSLYQPANFRGSMGSSTGPSQMNFKR
ncbi:hypothetical protein PS865_04440 [Pseudomonas fluorescens]|uniref:hypothetical protein n=1 Tax=Pseudomonas fluorescens TaxID=294 RepID=UPI001241CEE8|nr:hypothetical protein [Pseudomonas fluorescens]VVP32587.1 hypothetical protein PS865_04440 [Pseudomonas fluorescens]